MSTSDASIAFLYSLQSFGMKLGLRNIRALLRSVGDPHRSFPSIHIAGTNGKGSTSAMIAAVLTAAGYRVGLYTSPHLVLFNERIRINGASITDARLARYVRLLRPEIIQRKATFFEATTAVAFRYFADEKVDIAVIETGLGGRLDATNVLRPLVSVITTIGKDHTEQLGPTLSSIAAEKAGIIKRRVPVVMGNIRGDARKVMWATAAMRNAPLVEAMGMPLPQYAHPSFPGKHQFDNARTTMAALTIISRRMPVGDAAIRQGMERTAALSGLRARFEIIEGHPRIILDAAHNPDGVRTMVDAARTHRASGSIVLLAMMKDKDVRSSLRSMKRLSPSLVITAQPSTERAMTSEHLAAECHKAGLRTLASTSVPQAVRSAKRAAGRTGTIIVTGSHYLIGEVIPLLQKTS